jgi:hypothetical protein
VRRTSPDIDVATAVALLQTLNGEILGSRSATHTLETWCRRQRLGEEPRIVAKQLKGRPKALRPEQREWLQVSPTEEVKHRKVQLLCGNRVLSEADNWYLPNRLTAEMNRLLETTDTPFGKAVQPLNPRRRTLEVKLLWPPLSEGQGKNAKPTRGDSGFGVRTSRCTLQRRQQAVVSPEGDVQAATTWRRLSTVAQPVPETVQLPRRRRAENSQSIRRTHARPAQHRPAPKKHAFTLLRNFPNLHTRNPLRPSSPPVPPAASHLARYTDTRERADAQNRANREHAKKPAGPRTEEGKKASSKNAVSTASRRRTSSSAA